MAGRLLVGTSGYSYKEWKGPFYPEKLPDKQMLADYSSRLPSVEVNYTFRRMPTEKTIQGWKERAADGFEITLKAPQRITHWKRLEEAQDDVDEFVRLARGLGDKLGVLLFQLPPTLKYRQELLESFLAGLPPVCKYAMEFRHDSWKADEVSELLNANGVSLCGADTEASPLNEVPIVGNHSYLRLRQESYDQKALALWTKRIGKVLESGRDVFCYFKHEEGAAAPKYATALKEALA